jgi:hypothetical protein
MNKETQRVAADALIAGLAYRAAKLEGCEQDLKHANKIMFDEKIELYERLEKNAG